MMATLLLSVVLVMNAAPTPIRTNPKELLPVTRLVSTLSMTVLNGQLVARPLIRLAAAS